MKYAVLEGGLTVGRRMQGLKHDETVRPQACSCSGWMGLRRAKLYPWIGGAQVPVAPLLRVFGLNSSVPNPIVGSPVESPAQPASDQQQEKEWHWQGP
jgi:hypothetical protein